MHLCLLIKSNGFLYRISTLDVFTDVTEFKVAIRRKKYLLASFVTLLSSLLNLSELLCIQTLY